MQLQQRSPAD